MIIDSALYAVPDPCASNPCDPNAMCERIELTADFTCTCIPPYTGDGFTCTREWNCMRWVIQHYAPINVMPTIPPTALAMWGLTKRGQQS